jgi:hypothetical protein
MLTVKETIVISLPRSSERDNEGGPHEGGDYS